MKVVSKKDQAQYWYPKDQPFSYVSVDEFESIFKELDFMWEGNKLRSSLSFNKASPQEMLCHSVFTPWENRIYVGIFV